eukprot:TRINITY_DN2917_c0_g1_i1.p2 TRINITY_DN2917_c0_g1~~TRINITY_DN2917_c0_g1_i1.p2  ORF type:complete len:318 (+),score=39.77 TRINITY_DN2917_c0_g1_i1:69-956(+)
MKLLLLYSLFALSVFVASNPVVVIQFAELFIDPDDFELFFGAADVYIRCSADGGLTFPIRADLDTLDKVGKKTGPWKFTEWLPAFGSVLYCQAVEEDGGLDADDPLGESLVVFDFLKNKTSIDDTLDVSFYIMKKLSEEGSFQLGLQISLSCEDCDEYDYPLSPYWYPKDAPWPTQVAPECNATLGLKAGLNLADGKCCSTPDNSKLGDGICDDNDVYNTESCGFDFGDCCTRDNPECSSAQSFAQIVTITESFVRQAEESLEDPQNITAVLDAIGFEGEQLEVDVEPQNAIVEF